MALFRTVAMCDEAVTGLAPRSSCRFHVGPMRPMRRPLRHAVVRHLILPASAIRSSNPTNI